MKHDVIVIGGSYAGMAAALQPVRARRTVLVIDAGAKAEPLRQPFVWISQPEWHRSGRDRANGPSAA